MGGRTAVAGQVRLGESMNLCSIGRRCDTLCKKVSGRAHACTLAECAALFQLLDLYPVPVLLYGVRVQSFSLASCTWALATSELGPALLLPSSSIARQPGKPRPKRHLGRAHVFSCNSVCLHKVP